jgi:hypothetical protein
VEIVTLETMKKDTLSNGKIIVRTFPGQIAQVPVENRNLLKTKFLIRVIILTTEMVTNSLLNIMILVLLSLIN